MIARRFPDLLELRAVAEMRAVGRRLEGYAAVFNSPTRIADRFTETVRPGCFRDSLARAGADPICLVDHDSSRLLGRVSAGTLRLSEDQRGLVYSVDIPDTSVGRDLLVLAERGDLGGASIGFRVIQETWPAADQRMLHAVDVLEVSIVHSWPAYTATSVTARASSSGVTAEARRRQRFLATI